MISARGMMKTSFHSAYSKVVPTLDQNFVSANIVVMFRSPVYRVCAGMPS